MIAINRGDVVLVKLPFIDDTSKDKLRQAHQGRKYKIMLSFWCQKLTLVLLLFLKNITIKRDKNVSNNENRARIGQGIQPGL
jgi:hypothetical protein